MKQSKKYLSQFLTVFLAVAMTPIFAQAGAIISMTCIYVDTSGEVMDVKNEIIGFKNRKGNFVEALDKLYKESKYPAQQTKASLGSYTVSVTTKAVEYVEPMQVEFQVTKQIGQHQENAVIPATLQNYQTRVLLVNEDHTEIACTPILLVGEDGNLIQNWKK